MSPRRNRGLGVVTIMLGLLIIVLAAAITWSALSSDDDEVQPGGGTSTPAATSAPHQPEAEEPKDSKPFRSLRQRSIE